MSAEEQAPVPLEWEPYGKTRPGQEPWSLSWKADGSEWSYLVLAAPDGVTLAKWKKTVPLGGDARLHEALAGAVRLSPVMTDRDVKNAMALAWLWESGESPAALGSRAAWERP